MDSLPWAPLAPASLHISEEFVIPGGFPAWYRRFRPNPSRITTRMLVIVNVALLIACAKVALLGRPFGDCLLDDDFSGAVFERHLARVGQLQITLLLARRHHRRVDLRADGSLWI